MWDETTRGKACATNGDSVETKAITGEAVRTTVAAVEQTGQTCDAAVFDVRSAHWWNCAARKRIARSSAINFSLCIRLDMLS